ADKSVLETKVEPVTELTLSGSVTTAANAAAFIIADYGSNNLVTLRYRLKSLAVQAAEAPFRVGTTEFPAGSFIIAAKPDVEAQVKKAIEPLGLTAVGVAKMPDVARHDVDLPRLAMFSTWGSTQEVGWVRHAFDTYELQYDLIYKERIREGNLRAAYDVILIPNQAGSAKRLVFDIEPKGKPLAYTKSDQFPSLGAYGSSDDITGGMGLEGVVELQKFVQAGGVLITLGASSQFPTDFGLVRNVNSGRPSAQFYAPGPIVSAEILKPENPIFYGYTQRIVPVRYANGPLLQVPETDRDQQVLMCFPGGDDSVMSGLMKGANEIKGRPAIVDVPVGPGAGRVLFFAILHWNDIKHPAPQPTATAASAER